MNKAELVAAMAEKTELGEVWYRAWFGSKRPRVRIPILRPNTKVHLLWWTFLLYKENHALDAWFNKAYGGKQEIPVSMIERSANCSTARNRDSASQG